MSKYRILLLIYLSLVFFQGNAQLRLPKLIGDGVILQRDTELKLWGWASPNEHVTLEFKEKTFHTKADSSGNWFINMPPQEAGGPCEMIFKASNRLTVRNILFGDVWLCSGQSNMELTLERVKEKYPEVIANSANEEIRQFLVPDKYDFKKAHSDLDEGSWISADPETVLGFSAAAYFFAKELYDKYQVPIGLINAALGGSPVEAWISENTLKNFPESYAEMQKFKDDELIAQIQESDQQRSDQWYGDLNEKDEGLNALPNWSDPGADDDDWQTMPIPGFWSDYSTGETNGVAWFRKEINIPKSMAGKNAKLWFGRIVDQDYVYVNGELVGTTGYQYPPRRYEIGPGILKEGSNIFVVRVVNQSGKGGFIPDKPYYVAVGSDTIDLKGTWKYKLGATMPPLASQTFIRWKPGGLYNKMIAPLLNFKIKGVIWYQGESNADHPEGYADAFSALITDWRKRWNEDDFPFIFVQLANFMEETEYPVESDWAELRQAQLETLFVPNTGMAVTIDLGEWNDIHPLNKEDVGKRLAFQAQKLAYGDSLSMAEIPIPSHADFQKNKVTIYFEQTGMGLIAKGNQKLQYFSVSNDGKKFVWAKARVKENKVIVWSRKVKNPGTVRYAWADNPKSANLYTKDGMPVSPFEIKRSK